MRVRLACVAATLALSACERTTSRNTRIVNGQEWTMESTQPGIGESFVHGITHDCAGGGRDDDAARTKVSPLPDNCDRASLSLDYVTDGVYRVSGCSYAWRVRCLKTSTASDRTSPLGCGVSCFTEDSYRPAP